MPEYEEATEVRSIANDLIDKYHSNLRQAAIKYLYRDPAPRSGGKTVLGRATKVSGKYKAVSGFDFIIEISKLHFENMDQDKKKALIDLELMGETAQQLELPFDNERPNLEVVSDKNY